MSYCSKQLFSKIEKIKFFTYDESQMQLFLRSLMELLSKFISLVSIMKYLQQS